MNLLELEKTLQLLNSYGVSEFKQGDLHIVLPKPKVSLKNKISTISPEEVALIQKEDTKSVKAALEKQRQKASEDLDDILFAHEDF